jgi:glyoxylase-like metal-dependent hydrolase (beta-lactamase superfamily II)/rhodanese-related sulfurtransferase
LTATPPQWTAADLNERLERGDDFFVLDVRNREEFAVVRIEGRRELQARNVPYFEMLEAGGAEDLVESVERYARAELAADLPRDRPVLAVCAKGDTSQHVAEALARLRYDVTNLAGGMEAWCSFYDARRVDGSDGLAIWQVARPARGCLSYVLASGGRALVVDPARHVRQYVDLAEEEGYEIDGVIDTHGHADHISGGPALAEELGVPYWLHPYDGVHPLDVLPARVPYRCLGDGMEVPLGDETVRVLWIPGHTLGNTALHVGRRWLLSGDSIFVRSIARPDLGGKAEAWAPLHFDSLAALLELPADTVVLPGHFSARDEADGRGIFAAPLGSLRSANEGLRAVGQGRERFVQYILGSLPTFPPEYVDIKRVNAGLLQPDETLARELETGKNLCALAQAAGAPKR